MRPLPFKWVEGAMVPQYPRLAHEQYEPGHTYIMEAQEERSEASHRHYFASIREAWLNLPEAEAERFASPEHLRKWALIRAGYRNEINILCASKAEAVRQISALKSLDDHAVVIARDNLLIVYTAKSQSMKAMGKADFQKSKDDVLGTIADLIGVTPDALQQHARAA